MEERGKIEIANTLPNVAVPDLERLTRTVPGPATYLDQPRAMLNVDAAANAVTQALGSFYSLSSTTALGGALVSFIKSELPDGQLNFGNLGLTAGD